MEARAVNQSKGWSQIPPYHGESSVCGKAVATRLSPRVMSWAISNERAEGYSYPVWRFAKFHRFGGTLALKGSNAANGGDSGE